MTDKPKVSRSIQNNPNQSGKLRKKLKRTGSKLSKFQGIQANLDESRLTWKNPEKSEETCGKERKESKEISEDFRNLE